MENQKRRVAIYARVSSQEQATDGVSIDAQLALLRAHIEARGWDIFDEYVDPGYSGGTDERPALQRLIIDAKQRQFNIIVVSKLDRFFRSLRLLLNYLHDFEQFGISVVSVQEMLDTSSQNGKFAIQMMGVIAEFERGRIGERVKDIRQFMISRGDWAGGRPPYGYRWLADDRRWEVVPAEAEIVRLTYELYTNRKMGIEAIARFLNEEDCRTRDGALWSYSNVRYILNHPGYMGHHPLGMVMPPIVDETTWQQAQVRRDNARRVVRDPKGWLLQGMCVCGLCGHVLKCMHQKPKEPRYYACRGRVEQKHLEMKERCKLPYVRADKLEWAVWSKVRDILNDPERLAECVDAGLAELEMIRSYLGEKTLDIDEKLKNIRTKQERLGMAFADGAVPEAAYKTKFATLKKQEASLMRRRRNLDPAETADLAEVESRIAFVKDVLRSGELTLSDFGIFGQKGFKYFPAGFNAWMETDGELAIGEVVDMTTIKFEGLEGAIFKGIVAPTELGEGEDPDERRVVMARNLRTILQLFGIKVHVFPDKVEVRGGIPTQVLDLTKPQLEPTGPIISLASPEGKGE